MSSTYELCPAIEHETGLLVIRRVDKAYPVFLRCAAAHFPRRSVEAAAAAPALELCATLDDFAAAAARLVNQPILRPFEGGQNALVYVARPGKELLFQEFVEGLDEADGLPLRKSLPQGGMALTLVFADTVLETPPADGENQRGVEIDEANSAGDEADVRTVSELESEPVSLPVESDLQPRPAETGGLAERPRRDESLPPVDVVTSSTTALDDLLETRAAVVTDDGAPEPGEDAAGTQRDPFSEPALEILLRQAPRLQAPELGLGQSEQAVPEIGRGPAPEEVLAAVRHVVSALDDALRRQTDEHHAALQAVVAATEQAVQQQGRALEARQAEQWERQQAALRQMHAEQAAAIQTAITRLDEERAAWQQNAFREILQTSAQQLPGALRKMQDELAAREQQTLQQLRDDLLSRQPAAAAAPINSQPADLQELNWQLENAAVSTQDMRQRVGQLLWVNVLLMAVLIGLAVAAFWVLRNNSMPSAAPTAAAAASATAAPPTPIPPTPLPPTAVPSTPTAAATATTVATAVPAFAAALTCANADRPRNYYDCSLTNSGPVADVVALAIQPASDELNGFRPLVTWPDLQRIEPDPVTGIFSLGNLKPRETRPVRVQFPCTVTTGCAETTFAITPLVDGGRTVILDQIVNVTTHYFPPE